MNQWPLKFREFSGKYLFTDDAGGYFLGDSAFLDRVGRGALSEKDKDFLVSNGFSFVQVGDLEYTGFAARWARRIHVPGELNYVILVPTLRCDLDCEYCQVSRAPERAKGFDWSEEKLESVLKFLGGLKSRSVKIEFQGGEPLLRLDLLARVRAFCREKFESSQFVVCTNLQNVSEEAWAFLSDIDTHVSTSFDGTLELHQKNRTKHAKSTSIFVENFERAIRDLGPSRVSALPTIDPLNAPDPMEMIKSYHELGINSIYLRRINYQGFARKRYEFDAVSIRWQNYYRQFVAAMIEFNRTTEIPVEEYYLSHLLKRVLRGENNGHVDLRSPSWLAKDYIVIDYDGKFFPTDEARMVTRVGQIDLSIGSLKEGLDHTKIGFLNAASINQIDPDCQHCAYQQYCGLDVVDDLSRYGRIDIPRHTTAHCQNHLHLFDFVFELIYSTDGAVQNSVRAWLDLGTFPSMLAAVHE